jgi:hypothetical protein
MILLLILLGRCGDNFAAFLCALSTFFEEAYKIILLSRCHVNLFYMPFSVQSVLYKTKACDYIPEIIV